MIPTIPTSWIDLDRKLLQLVNRTAEAEGVSVCSWIENALREWHKLSWPEKVKGLAGAWPDDFPAAEDLRAEHLRDIQREPH